MILRRERRCAQYLQLQEQLNTYLLDYLYGPNAGTFTVYSPSKQSTYRIQRTSAFILLNASLT